MMSKSRSGGIGSYVVVAVVASGLLSAGTGCNSKDKNEPKGPQVERTSSGNETSTFTYTPGQAGGFAERTLKSSATVTAVDPSTRMITLTSDEDGTRATFKAPAAMHNLDQLKAGDKVNATLNEQLFVTVGGPSGGAPRTSYDEILARAPKGAKPGAMSAQMFDITGTVKAIDTKNRLATIEYADGLTQTVPARKDVDLSKYHPGDTVVIHVTQQLTVLAEKP